MQHDNARLVPELDATLLCRQGLYACVNHMLGERQISRAPEEASGLLAPETDAGHATGRDYNYGGERQTSANSRCQAL